MNDITDLPPVEAPTSHRRLEIVVEKGEKLQKDVHRTHGLKAFPVVFFGWKDVNEVYASMKQIHADPSGGSNPVWGAYDEFVFDTDKARQEKLYLFVRVYSKRQIGSGIKFVGEGRVGIEELLNHFGDAVDWKSVILGVKNQEGEVHGSVTFKYKFGRPHDPQPALSLLQQADPPLLQPANGNAVAGMGNLFRADITDLSPVEAPTSHRRLEIVVEKGEKLQKDVHRTHGLKAFPVVFLGWKDGNEVYASKKQIHADPSGGSNPVWGAYDEFVFEARQEKLYLFVRVYSKRKIGSGIKFVGEGSVDIEELLNHFGDAVDWKSVILGVKNQEGEEHGSVTFKYKFGRPHDPQPALYLLQQADPPLLQPANRNAVAWMGILFRAGVCFTSLLELITNDL